MSRFVADRAYDYFDLGDESDQDRAESSEDEIDIILHGTPEQRRHLRHIHQKEQQRKVTRQAGQLHSQDHHGDQQSSSEDEFEREMNVELEKTVLMLEKSRGKKSTPGHPSTSSAALPVEGSKQAGSTSTSSKKNEQPFYDNIYFDSDDDENYEGEGDAKVQRHHAQLSNDDLLYDPDMDDDDQKWVDQQRRRQHGDTNQTTGSENQGRNKKQATPKSDAVLDCPACMTTLCFDCQRHDIYPNQYRAMFVMNCKVNTSELLSVPEQAAKKKFKKSKKAKSRADSAETAESSVEQSSVSKDKFHPVSCEECDTVVGVVDMDEVYHFFNVLPSQP